jgi:hypothetical protein
MDIETVPVNILKKCSMYVFTVSTAGGAAFDSLQGLEINLFTTAPRPAVGPTHAPI